MLQVAVTKNMEVPHSSPDTSSPVGTHSGQPSSSVQSECYQNLAYTPAKDFTSSKDNYVDHINRCKNIQTPDHYVPSSQYVYQGNATYEHVTYNMQGNQSQNCQMFNSISPLQREEKSVNPRPSKKTRYESLKRDQETFQSREHSSLPSYQPHRPEGIIPIKMEKVYDQEDHHTSSALHLQHTTRQNRLAASRDAKEWQVGTADVTDGHSEKQVNSNVKENVDLIIHKSESADHNRSSVAAGSSDNSIVSVTHQPVGNGTQTSWGLFDNCDGKDKDMTLDDFLHKNPTNKRHEFNNAVAIELFPLKHFLFPSKRAFQNYLSEQQKWRWEFYQAYIDVATRVNNTLYKPSSGFAQNCARFNKMPENPRGEDVRRCEATSKVLEDIAARIADLRIELLKRKGTVIYTETGEARFQPCISELQFLEHIFDETDKLYQGVLTMLSNVNTTWEKLHKLFSEEQVERADRQRVLRRQRENLRKKKKRALISLEKAATKLLNRVAPIVHGRAEQQRAVDDLNILELNMLDSKRDAELLQFLLEKQCFTAQAGEVIVGKIRMLDVICGTNSVPSMAASS